MKWISSRLADLLGRLCVYLIKNLNSRFFKPTSTTTSILIDSSVYVFSGQWGMNYPIMRIDLEEDDIIATSVVGFHKFKQWYPILFLTTKGSCAPEFLKF